MPDTLGNVGDPTVARTDVISALLKFKCSGVDEWFTIDEINRTISKTEKVLIKMGRSNWERMTTSD